MNASTAPIVSTISTAGAAVLEHGARRHDERPFAAERDERDGDV
jgi:hypothetical protein